MIKVILTQTASREEEGRYLVRVSCHVWLGQWWWFSHSLWMLHKSWEEAKTKAEEDYPSVTIEETKKYQRWREKHQS